MCGIVGIIYKDKERKCDKAVLSSMRDVLVHRGPDDKGILVDGHVGLGHRRLSIIDLGGGRQPMSNEDDSVWIIYNGETYNYKHLRKELIARGHIFKTECDTEVILHLYEEKGEKCVDELNGMFAFAIWDKKNQTIFLARDRMGIKPLYYVQTEQFFMFSSEIKSFFKNDEFTAEYNDKALYEYLLFRDVAGERTLFEGVKRLLPGHTLTLHGNNIKINQYWSLFPGRELNNITFDEAVEELTYLIKDAVNIRLMSDVPLGTFCSGGIDSSLVTAIAANAVNSPINTFSVGFNEEEYDETSYARMVSKKYGTNHHELRLSNREFAEYLPRMIWQNDEPLNYTNSIHMYAISKLAKEFVTVVLTGEGADELFVGYPRYQIPRLVEAYQRVPDIFKKLIYNGLGIFKDHRIQKLRNNMAYSAQEAVMYNASVLDRDFVSSIFDRKNGTEMPFREDIMGAAISKNMTPMAAASMSDQHTYLVSILNRQDKMSMAASVESRVPFLDYRVVEFSNSLPLSYKVNKTRGKFILKEIASNYLPDDIIFRKKSGFGVPIAQWMRENKGLGELVENVFTESNFPDFLNRNRVASIIAEHKAGTNDHSEFLWSAVNLTLWKTLFKD